MDEPHRRRTMDQKLAENHFELDYSFLKTDTSIAERFEESSDTILSIVDSGTGMTLCDQDSDILHSTAGLQAGEAPK